MAIYKPSNLSPNLQEIDVTEENNFSCQVNTSGSSIQAYKIQILSGDGNSTLFDGIATDLGTNVKNKDQLIVQLNPTDFSSNNIINGKDYQWNIRTYNAQVGSTNQPQTGVCTGFLVGSTSYVIWTNDNDKIQTDRWVEISTTGTSSFLPILEPNVENLVLPSGSYTERHKIIWVETDLGWNNNITKIELDNGFTYNYKDGTSFSLFQCSDQHTLNSVFVDPNDIIERGKYITISGVDSDKHKIIGYGEETGEIRVQEPFSSIPQNGQAYVIYELNESGSYTSVTGNVAQVVGGSAITDSSFTIITNRWDSTAKRLFIQPNINIKTDLTNPNEIVFNDGTRVDIIKTISTTVVPGQNIDITFNKLDNTQWLLEYLNSSSSSVPIIPKSPYTVYTDFMDSQPNAIFYARLTPTIQLQYKNLNDDNGNYINISSTTSQPWRDISFQATWYSQNNVQVKYYQYSLYDNTGELIEQSDEYYDIDLTWSFKGFQTSDYENLPNQYNISLKIVDELDKIFTVNSNFLIFYNTQPGIVPLEVNFNCEEHAIDVIASSPVYVESTNTQEKSTVTSDNLAQDYDYLEIPNNLILNYTNVINPDKTPIEIPKTFSFLTQFQITGDFIDNIPDGETLTIFEIAHYNPQNEIDIFTLKLNSFRPFYVTNEGTIAENQNAFKIQLFKNGSNQPLMCFNNGTQDYYDIYEEDIYQQFIKSEYPQYALQNNSLFQVVSTFPYRPTTGVNYLLTNDIVYNGIIYYSGAYNYINSTWQAQTDKEYFFIESLSQVPGFSYQDLNAPSNTQNSDNNTLSYTDDNNLWVETNYNFRQNQAVLNMKWFTLYLLIDNTTDTEIVNCNIQIKNERG